jgi:hypothetical protein
MTPLAFISGGLSAAGLERRLRGDKLDVVTRPQPAAGAP